MKIGINATYASMPYPTGIGNYTINLIRQLTRLDKKNQYTLYYRSKIKKENFLNLDMPSRKFEPAFTFLMRDELDLFHDPAFKYVRIGKSRSIVTIHDIVVSLSEDYTSDHFKKSQSPKLMKAARRSDSIIAVSQFTKNELMQKLNIDEKKIFVVHHGIDRGIFKPRGRTMLVYKKNKVPENFILFVGNIEKRKNITGIVEVFEKVSFIHKDLYLVLIGRDGYGADEIRAGIDRSRIKKRILMLDYIAPEQMALFYQKARLFLFPSFYEGFGLPLLEAMACGCPVITSRSSSLSEVAGQAALYTDPSDTYDMVNKTLNLLEDPSLKKKLVDHGFDRIKNFSWEMTAKRTMKVYESFAV